MVVAEGGRSVCRVVLRVLCLAGCALGFALLLAILAPSSGTAHAQAEAGHDATAETALWSDPSSLSATAARRAGGESAAPPLVATSGASEHPSAPAQPGTGPHAPAAVAPTTSPLGPSTSGGGGAPDTGPSLTQIAVVSAALLGVRWLSQRLRSSELSWRNTLLTLSIERPG
jgi:hypothetical protein